ADLLQLQEHLSSDIAVVAREQAEMAKAVPAFPNQDSYQKLQADIWRKRHDDYVANVKNFDGQILSTQALIYQYKSDVVQYTQRLKLASEVENTYQPLLAQGYVSKLQVLTATDNRTEIARLLADAENLVESNVQTMAALKAQRDAYIQQWYSDTGTQLVLDENDLDTTRQGLEKAQKLRDL